jgi:hypothetical protein
MPEMAVSRARSSRWRASVRSVGAMPEDGERELGSMPLTPMSLKNLFLRLLDEAEEGDVVLADGGVDEEKDAFPGSRQAREGVEGDGDLVADAADVHDDGVHRLLRENSVQGCDHPTTAFSL